MTQKIFFDAERIKYPNTGLYHFCKRLSTALLAQSFKSAQRIQLFVPAKNKTDFLEETKVIPIRFWHKYFLPNSYNIDVWHVSNQDSAYFPFRFKKPIVFTIHDLNYYHNQRKTIKKRNKWLKELQLKVNASDYICFISEYSYKDTKKLIDFGNKPVKIIYNGCNISSVEELGNPPIKPYAPFLFTIGTITEKKNFHVLPALLVNNHRQLVIAGITLQESYKQAIIEAAKNLGVSDRIIFTGVVSEQEKYWYYKNCEAFVFPSIAEGFGLPVIEAMYFGKPVFLSTRTSLPEIGGDAAYYFQDFNEASMRKVLEDGLIHFLTHNRAVYAAERAAFFSWDKAAKAYLDIYQLLAG